MGFTYPDKDIRFYLPNTFQEIFIPHAWVDQDDDRAYLEECKGECNKLNRGFNHQYYPVTFCNASISQIPGKPVCQTVNLFESPRSIPFSFFAYKTVSIRIYCSNIGQGFSDIVVHALSCF